MKTAKPFAESQLSVLIKSVRNYLVFLKRIISAGFCGKSSHKHCGISIDKDFVEIASFLKDDKPYKVYVIRYGDPLTEPLWRHAVKVETKVFRETDGNSFLSLWWAYRRYKKSTVLLLAVDQRLEKIPVPAPVGMMRLVFGSAAGLPTSDNMKYWGLEASQALIATGLSPDLPYLPSSMDITMVAVLKEYRQPGYAGANIQDGLYAKTCYLSKHWGITRWLTILARLPYRLIQKRQCEPFSRFSVDAQEGPYFGSPNSLCYWSDQASWHARLLEKAPDVYKNLFEDGIRDFSYGDNDDVKRLIVRNHAKH